MELKYSCLEIFLNDPGYYEKLRAAMDLLLEDYNVIITQNDAATVISFALKGESRPVWLTDREWEMITDRRKEEELQKAKQLVEEDKNW